LKENPLRGGLFCKSNGIHFQPDSYGWVFNKIFEISFILLKKEIIKNKLKKKKCPPWPQRAREISTLP
jgi:hypothetical protein